jgi:hypothetical protein
LRLQVGNFCRGELKTKLGWEPIGIAPGGLIESFGKNSVEFREVTIKNDPGFSNGVDDQPIGAGCRHRGAFPRSLPLPTAANQ